MNRYVFTLAITGLGDNENDALTDALEELQDSIALRECDASMDQVLGIRKVEEVREKPQGSPNLIISEDGTIRERLLS